MVRFKYSAPKGSMESLLYVELILSEKPRLPPITPKRWLVILLPYAVGVIGGLSEDSHRAVKLKSRRIMYKARTCVAR